MPEATVKVSDLWAAMRAAQTLYGDDWQAEVLEILLVPPVYAYWRAINTEYGHGAPTLTRHAGVPNPGKNVPEDFDWALVAGYVMRHGCDGVLRWNSVRSDHWCHAPGTAWDGVRRETVHRFAEQLRWLTGAQMGGLYGRAVTTADKLRDEYGITTEFDLTPQFAVRVLTSTHEVILLDQAGDRYRRWQGDWVGVTGDEHWVEPDHAQFIPSAEEWDANPSRFSGGTAVVVAMGGKGQATPERPRELKPGDVVIGLYQGSWDAETIAREMNAGRKENHATG